MRERERVREIEREREREGETTRVRDNERERDREGGREIEREGDRQCVGKRGGEGEGGCLPTRSPSFTRSHSAALPRSPDEAMTPLLPHIG